MNTDGMKEDFHIDMSGRIYKKVTIGIACLGTRSKKHNGCALRSNLIKLIEKTLCVGDISEEHAKIYAICIYLLIKDRINDIETLIICNDEEFTYVKEYLLILLGETATFKIISISDLRKMVGRNIKSLADNFAKCYRKRGLNQNKWDNGKHLDVIEVNFEIIKGYWDLLINEYK
jgi:hypothetical protein